MPVVVFVIAWVQRNAFQSFLLIFELPKEAFYILVAKSGDEESVE